MIELEQCRSVDIHLGRVGRLGSVRTELWKVRDKNGTRKVDPYLEKEDLDR
jgi:hypothetical protein